VRKKKSKRAGTIVNRILIAGRAGPGGGVVGAGRGVDVG